MITSDADNGAEVGFETAQRLVANLERVLPPSKKELIFNQASTVAEVIAVMTHLSHLGVKWFPESVYCKRGRKQSHGAH